MSNATKCDRCGECYEYGGMTVGEEYDLCDGCVADFEAWIDAGVHGENVTESPELSHDTREQLESDAQKFAQVYYADHLLVYDKVMALLDRQAAITEREVKLRELHKFEENHRWHVRSIEEVNQQLNERIKELEDKVRRQAESIGEWELRCESMETERDEWKTKFETREFAYKQADAERKRYSEQIDELRAEIATLKEHRAGNMERLHELTDECAELRKYLDEWKGLAEKYRADSIAAQEETERYRAKLGDVLDALHEAERAAR